MNMKIEQLLERIRIEYEDEIGECIEPSCRRRDKVEIRAALANAIRPYATFRQISDMLGKGVLRGPNSCGIRKSMRT